MIQPWNIYRFYSKSIAVDKINNENKNPYGRHGKTYYIFESMWIFWYLNFKRKQWNKCHHSLLHFPLSSFHLTYLISPPTVLFLSAATMDGNNFDTPITISFTTPFNFAPPLPLLLLLTLDFYLSLLLPLLLLLVLHFLVPINLS